MLTCGTDGKFRERLSVKGAVPGIQRGTPCKRFSSSARCGSIYTSSVRHLDRLSRTEVTSALRFLARENVSGRPPRSES